ncbi:rhodanese-like domain-containing protein [Halobacteriovorax sp. HLS]|uniref:rhodanese-like domain-containing protein n=1 Tax=Halobacteriovorax sp. HLS TaxID=2234000 RepID=UPI000FD71957|nr:rhodanese-like domain-containing protein [Halobacteriovorax sp. HLS]
MDLKLFQMLEFMNNRLSNIEKNISRIDEKLEFSLSLQRNHLIRVKNGEYIDDSNILMGRPYNDLSPQKALEIYNNPDLDYIILDVSNESYQAPIKLDGCIKISLEDLNTRYAELQSKTTPILIFSEQGLRSIQACEMLIKKGFFNLNNVSGGYRFWPNLENQNSVKRA